jgi:hypothetical protein
MNHTDARFDAMCPTEETLAAYLAASGSLPPELTRGWGRTAFSDEEMRALSAHVGACDRCVDELRTATRRLSLAAEIPVAVPAQVAARAAAAAAQPAAAAPSRSGARLADLRERLKAVVRMPILVPMALAALALIVIVPRLQTAPDSELTRAVELRQAARITADSAAVRQQPTAEAAVIATLNRGDSTVLVAQDGDWYRVALADGGEGWIERRAFE